MDDEVVLRGALGDYLRAVFTELGAVAVVHKPFDMKLVANAVAGALQQPFAAGFHRSRWPLTQREG